jgi:hypothetical protein
VQTQHKCQVKKRNFLKVNISVLSLWRRDLPVIGLEELASDPNKVQCLLCQAHVFGASSIQRKGVKTHVESQAHQRAVKAAAEAKEEESAHQIKIRRLDGRALEADARRFTSSLSGTLPTKRPPAPQISVNQGETLREREMWEKFEMGGLENTELFDDDPDEDEVIDAALRRFHAINLGTIGPTDSNPFYDDGDETITNVMRMFGNATQCSR